VSFTQLRADCAINPPTLAAGRLIAVWAAQPEPGLWRWRLEHWNKKDGNGVTERFKWLAQSAAARLGFAGGNDDAVSFWLDQIKRDAPESHLREFFVEEEESNQLYAVEILDICGLSADYCWKCEAEEIMSQAVSAKTTSGFPPAEQEIGGFGTQHGFAEGVDPFQENGRPLGENPFPQEHPVHAAFEEATWKSATRIAQYKLDFMRANCPNKQEFLKSILTFRKRWFTTVAFEATLIVGDEETAHWYEHWIGDRAKWLVEDTLAKVKRKDPNAGPASPPFFSPKDIEFIERDLTFELLQMVTHYQGLAASRVVEVMELRNAEAASAAGELEPVSSGDQPSGTKSVKRKSALGRNVDRLRKECGWSFDDLARVTDLDKKLILGT
jgi:hypothetical protein